MVGASEDNFTKTWLTNIWFKAFEFTGLGRGGQQVQKTKEVYAKAVETLVELASLQVTLVYHYST
jgi:vacuolar-type H+-ATPase subunit D/Vma8